MTQSEIVNKPLIYVHLEDSGSLLGKAKLLEDSIGSIFYFHDDCDAKGLLSEVWAYSLFEDHKKIAVFKVKKLHDTR